MKTRFLTIFALFAFSLVPQAHASCTSHIPISSEIGSFNEAQTIFVGKVLEVYNPHPDTHPGTEEYDTITFAVDYYLKGNLKADKVTSSHDSAGYNEFERGQSYLVFAFGGINEVSICTPPILLSQAGPVLLLFYVIQYSFVIIPVVIGGIVFVVWKKRK